VLLPPRSPVMGSHHSFHSTSSLADLLLNLEGPKGTGTRSSGVCHQTPALGPETTNHPVAFISHPQVVHPMKAYRAVGSFKARKRQQEFTLDFVASDEEDARHRLYSNFGSRHGVPRRFVNIESLEEIDPSESIAPTVVAHFRSD